MKEWKMHNMEEGRTCTPQKMTKKSQRENDRMENAHPETRKMAEKSHPENDRKSLL